MGEFSCKLRGKCQNNKGIFYGCSVNIHTGRDNDQELVNIYLVTVIN